VKYTNSCTLCEEVVEDLLHLFCNCKHVTPILTTVKNWLNRCGFNNMVMFSHADILLRIDDQHVIVNFIILIVKFAVYKCRLQNKIPHFAVVQAYIKYVMNIERYTAVTNNCSWANRLQCITPSNDLYVLFIF
jgi:hypothetical protein